MAETLASLMAEIRACRLCIETPRGKPLPHEPRPVIRGSPGVRLGVFGQAPGTRVHASGIPFHDPSGDRLRHWMAVSPDEFYDERRTAIVPMGFCFPGLDAHGSDLPPRPECASAWRARVIAALPGLEVVLLIGLYAQRWHLSAPGAPHRATVADTVARWRDFADRPGPRLFPLPHPSWRNNHWLERNPWFEAELLPDLRAIVRRVV